ncbi:hypothetical protein HA402_006475 [Bradysia odoriphaga]|nr:hypothetical protein HA402_006475 [Bradysia odoriphaga]
MQINFRRFLLELCSYTYHLSYLQNLPTCELDGSFSAKQCKGGKIAGRCFCHNEQGERIFGFDWWKNAENMTCACSRHRARLEAAGRLDVTLHCARNGNYEPLQCDSGVCWCADPKTGVIVPGTGRAVPQGLWKLLPCYNADEMGTEYLRECESASHAQMLLKQKLYTHGTTDVSLNNLQCDYDGSYGKYKIENGIASCMWRDGTKIGSYQAGANLVGQMNCYCARDHKHFEEAGLSLTLSCTGNGNYEKTQGFNGKIFCVDRDGFAVTSYFGSVIGLDCDPFYYYEIKEPLE